MAPELVVSPNQSVASEPRTFARVRAGYWVVSISRAPWNSANSGRGPASVKEPFGHPAPGGDAEGPGDPPAGLVGSGLPAGDDPLEHGFSLQAA